MGWSVCCVCVCVGGGGGGGRGWGGVCVVCVCGGGGGEGGAGQNNFRKSTSEQDLWSQRRDHHLKPPQVLFLHLTLQDKMVYMYRGHSL